MAEYTPEFKNFLDRIDRVLRHLNMSPEEQQRVLDSYITPQRMRADMADVLGPQKNEIHNSLRKTYEEVLQKQLADAAKARVEKRSFGPLDKDLLDAIDEAMNAVQAGDYTGAVDAEKIISEAVHNPRDYGIGLQEAHDLEKSAKQAVEYSRQREADMLEQLFPELGKTTREELIRQNPHLTEKLNVSKLQGQMAFPYLLGTDPQLVDRAKADMRELAGRISGLSPDQDIIVFHGTDEATANKLLSEGLDVSKKAMTTSRAEWEAGVKNPWTVYGDSPGAGLYVTLDPTLAEEASYFAGRGKPGKIVALRMKVGDLGFPPEAFMSHNDYLNYYNSTFGFPEGKFPVEAPRAAWVSDIGGMVDPTRYISPAEAVDVTDLVKSVSLDYRPNVGVRSLSDPVKGDATAEWFRNSLLDRFDEKWGSGGMQKTVTPFPEIPASQRGLPAPAAAAEDVGVVIPKTTEAASKAGKLESIASMLRGEGRFGKVGKVLGKVGRGAVEVGDLAFGAQAAAAAPHIGYSVGPAAMLTPNYQPGTFSPGFFKAAQKVSELPYSGVGPTVAPKSPAFQGGGGGGLKFQ